MPNSLAAIRLDRAAYRFASITLAIVILASHGQRAWITAGHRFIEVAIGIAIGLVATAVWPERTDNSPEARWQWRKRVFPRRQRARRRPVR